MLINRLRTASEVKQLKFPAGYFDFVGIRDWVCFCRKVDGFDVLKVENLR